MEFMGGDFCHAIGYPGIIEGVGRFSIEGSAFGRRGWGSREGPGEGKARQSEGGVVLCLMFSISAYLGVEMYMSRVFDSAAVYLCYHLPFQAFMLTPWMSSSNNGFTLLHEELQRVPKSVGQ